MCGRRRRPTFVSSPPLQHRLYFYRVDPCGSDNQGTSKLEKVVKWVTWRISAGQLLLKHNIRVLTLHRGIFSPWNLCFLRLYSSNQSSSLLHGLCQCVSNSNFVEPYLTFQSSSFNATSSSWLWAYSRNKWLEPNYVRYRDAVMRTFQSAAARLGWREAASLSINLAAAWATINTSGKY